jgi:hypothetical protein
VTVTVYPPTVTLATVKEPVIDPSDIEHFPDAIASPDSKHVESSAEKPDASTCTVLPTRAEEGFNVIIRGMLDRMRVAAVESRAGLPVAVTIYATGAPLVVRLATVKDPVNVPLDTVQD